MYPRAAENFKRKLTRLGVMRKYPDFAIAPYECIAENPNLHLT